MAIVKNFQIYGVYCVHNEYSAKRYICRSQNLPNGIEQTLKSLKGGMHTNTFLQQDFNNGDRFNVTILWVRATLKYGLKDNRELQAVQGLFIQRFRTVENAYSYNFFSNSSCTKGARSIATLKDTGEKI